MLAGIEKKLVDLGPVGYQTLPVALGGLIAKRDTSKGVPSELTPAWQCQPGSGWRRRSTCAGAPACPGCDAAARQTSADSLTAFSSALSPEAAARLSCLQPRTTLI